jgi:Tle cognate immunity protein 4 C-terminal domain/Tle cognate immunity protein 4 N-terminal domain
MSGIEKWTKFLVLTMGISLAACQPKTYPLTEQEKQHMSTITEQLTTRCVGRYLVDLPTGFILNPIRRILIEGIEIDVEPMAKAKFDAVYRQRSVQLANAKQSAKPHFPVLHETNPISGSDETGAIFNRAESGSSGRVGRTLELFAWKKGYTIIATLEAWDWRFPEYADKAGIRSIPPNVSEKLALLLDVYNRTQGRPDTEVPNGPGVCIPNGIVRGPATDTEQLDINYYLDGTNDVSFALHSLSNTGPEETELLDRSAAIESSLKQKNGYTLRKGRVRGKLEGAQEWLMTYKPDKEIAYQSFTLEANSKKGSAEAPLIVLDFGVGSRIVGPQLSLEELAVRKPLLKATLSEAQAIALWDVVALTLRPRPGAF